MYLAAVPVVYAVHKSALIAVTAAVVKLHYHTDNKKKTAFDFLLRTTTHTYSSFT